MRKKFVFISLIISIIYIPSIYTAEEEQVIGEVRIENVIFNWKGKGTKEFCKCMKDELDPDPDCKKFTISLPGGETRLQIGPKGYLVVTGNKKQERVIVRDPSGRITFNTEKQKKTDVGSLDEEESSYKEKEQLQAGSNVTLESCSKTVGSSANISVFYDKEIILKRVVNNEFVDNFELPVLYSDWSDSQLFLIGTFNYGSEREGNKAVHLDETVEEIELLNDFFKCDQEGKKKLLGRLSIVECVMLLTMLHKHGCIKEFNCKYFDYVRQVLEEKVSNVLEQAIGQNMFYWSTEIGWFKEIRALPWTKKRIIEDVLRRVI